MRISSYEASCASVSRCFFGEVGREGIAITRIVVRLYAIAKCVFNAEERWCKVRGRYVPPWMNEWWCSNSRDDYGKEIVGR